MADGTITIDTEIDEKGIKAGIRDIEASAKRMAATVGDVGEKNKIAIQKQVDAISRLNHQYEQQKQKVDALKEKIKDLSKAKIETEEYKKIKQELAGLNLEFEKVETKQREWLEMGFAMDSGPLKELDRQLDEIWKDMERLQRKQNELKNSGRAYLKPEKTQEYKEAVEKWRIENKKLLDTNSRLDTSFLSLKQKVKECGKEALKSGTKFQSLAKAAKNLSSKAMTSGIDGLKKRLDSINRTVEKLLRNFLKLSSGAISGGLKRLANGIFAIHKSANKTTMSFGRMLGTSLLLAGAFRAISGIINGIGTGFNNLVQYSEAVNVSVSSLYSALIRLQNAFATAFAPILTVAAPYLASFMDMLADAATYVGMFFARLTGQEYFLKAKKVQADYAKNLGQTADSTEDVADATKEATKALKGYLSPIDEINKYSKDGSFLPGKEESGGIDTITTPSDMFEKVPIEDSIKHMADRLKRFIESKDWEGLGAYIANGINKGLQKIYNVINWDNVGPKVIPFVDAFTRTFNSLVDNIDWDLLGRTLGAGVNTIVNTLNLLITGIDWKNLGKKFAEGITGIIHEVDWDNLGELLGNWFMVSWDVFNGMVHNLPYEDIGKAIADALNGAFREISFAEIGDTLATGLNGAFTSLYSFAVNFDWQQLVDNVTDGMNTFFTEFDWKGNGEKLNVFITNLLDSLLEIAETTDWESFGRGVGEFLGEIDWLSHLSRIGDIIKEVLGGIFDGLEESGTAGKIAAFLGRAFVLVKIADITGLSSLVKLVVGAIGKKLISEENVSHIAKMLKDLFGKGTSQAGDLLGSLGKAAGGASGGFSSLASSIGPLIGTAGLIAAVTAGTVGLTKGIAGLVEKIQGGNGELSTMGASLNTLAGSLQQVGIISDEQAREIGKIVDSCEDAGMSAEQMANTVMQKFAEWGVSTQNVNAVLQDNNYWTSQVRDNVDLLAQSAQMLGEGMSQTAEAINLSGLTTKEAIGGIRDSLWELSVSGSEFSGTYQGVLFSLENTLPSATTAQQAMDMVVGQLKAAGVPADELVKILGKKFPQATLDVRKSAVQNLPEAQKQISESMKTSEENVVTATGNMKNAAETNMKEVSRVTKQNFGEVNEDTIQKWGSSSGEVKKNLDKMKQAAAMKLAEMTETIRSYFTSMYNISTSKWEYARKQIVDVEMENMENGINSRMENIVSTMQSFSNRMYNAIVSGVSGASNAITYELNNIVSKVNNMIHNINSSIGGVERAFTFSYNFYNPMTHTRYWGNYWMNLPRVGSIPYLAQGAVIPPRSEFLAVLGDQKHGNNIETPEGLLRKIVREETGGTGSNTYDVAVNVAGRTLLDIIIDEAELRQSRNGKNPFALGGA